MLSRRSLTIVLLMTASFLAGHYTVVQKPPTPVFKIAQPPPSIVSPPHYQSLDKPLPKCDSKKHAINVEYNGIGDMRAWYSVVKGNEVYLYECKFW